MARINSETIQLKSLPESSPCTTESLMPWLVKSRSELGELKGFSSVFSKKSELLLNFILIESVDSMILDGINWSREAALEGQLLNETEQSFENRQSLGIRKALIWGKEQIARQPLNELLLRSLHSMIIGKKADGFREKNSSNNFKNPSISPLHQFPDPGQIKFLVEDLIQFTKNEDPKLDPLVRTLIAHAQYEAIKPFEGSSGRSARLLLQLLLLQADLLTKPILCISNHLKKNFDAYSKLLQDAVWNGNWCPYLKFMLHGIAIQAKDTREKLHRFEDLYNEYQAEIKNKCPQIYTLDLVDSLFNLPVISPLRLSSKLKIHYTTATRYLKKLEDEGFLENKPSGKYQLYINKKVFQLLNQ